MRASRLLNLISCVAFLTLVAGPAAFAADASKATADKAGADKASADKASTDKPSADKPDALKDKGLVKSGNMYALTEETELLDAMKALRQTKGKADRESRMRLAAESKIAANQKAMKDNIKEYEDLERRSERVQDPNIKNRMITRMNLLAGKVKDAQAAQKDLEEEANKLTSEAKTKYVDELATVAPKIEAAAEKYKTLAEDEQVKAELAKGTGANKLTLGPSPDMATAIADIKKWRSEINSEAIPLREEHGVQTVEAIVNGVSTRMTVSTGNADVLIPWDLAKKLDITPGEKDPSIQLKLVNGQLVEGKKMTLKSVRVGRFTVNNVPCVVLQDGLPEPPTILVASFLSHFVVNLNQQKGELHLTEVKEDKKGSVIGKPI